MIVSFSASLRTIEQDIDIYKKILSILRTLGCSIANDWVESARLYQLNKSRDKPEQDWRHFCEHSKAGIESSDLAIIEGSGFASFGVGYEAGYAIKIKKPTLILIKKEDIKVSYAAGLGNDLVTVASYTNENLGRIIKTFVKDNSIRSKDMRFNFVIDRQIYNHLRKKSFRTGKTKAEIVRDIVLEDIHGKGI